MQPTFCVLVLFLFMIGCREPYEPPAIKAPNRFLVVEGVINTLPDSKTTIQLSRTNNLLDTFETIKEGSAIVLIEAKSGLAYALQELSESIYSADHLTLNPTDQYRLHIRTIDGIEYFSDYVPVKQTPPIDSLTWQQDGDVTVFANTHDPANNARYYRWDYTETWQYRAILESNYGLGVSNGTIFYKDILTQTYNCWQTTPSTDIVLASSARLSQDVIYRQPVAVIPKNSEKINIRYSVLVRQYALTEEAYKYWDILRRNTQTLGTLFDAQPGQLKSNLYNVANPAEPVIGFVSACPVQEKRIFIENRDLFDWKGPKPNLYCGEQSISQDPQDPFRWSYPDTTYEPWYFLSPAGIRIAKKDCLDCRRSGGTNQKPFFW